MRLGLFRGRRWWPVNRSAPVGGHDAAVAPRPRRAPGVHRKRSRQPAGGDRSRLAAAVTATTDLATTDLATTDLATTDLAAAALAASRGVTVNPSVTVNPRATASPGVTDSAAANAGAAAAAYARPPGAAAARAAIRTSPGSLPRIGTPREAAAQPAGSWLATQAGGASTTVRYCGPLESVLIREWAPDSKPPAASVTAITRLAELPPLVKEKLAAGLDAIHVGVGGVPDLDHMTRLKGVPLPSGRATWDACAGAYGERKIVVGTRPSPTPDVMCHEVGHALDDIDGVGGRWLSDSAEFQDLYGRCVPYMASEFHRHESALGRREFFADAFAAIASSQRPALVEMLGGNTRAALDVMLYFNVRYGM